MKQIFSEIGIISAASYHFICFHIIAKHYIYCNTLLIQINLKLIQISKTRGEESLVGGRPPDPPLATALLGKLY